VPHQRTVDPHTPEGRAQQPLRRGERRGGAAILLADQITAEGMRITTFTDETKSGLAELLGCKVGHASDSERARIVQRVAPTARSLRRCDDDRLLRAIRLLNTGCEYDVIVAALYFQVPYLSSTSRAVDRAISGDDQAARHLAPRFSGFVQQTRDYMTQQHLQTYTVPMVRPSASASTSGIAIRRSIFNTEAESPT